MRTLVPALVVAIIGIVFLLYVWTERRRTVRRRELRAAREQTATAVLCLEGVEQEIDLQIAVGGAPDLLLLKDLVRDAMRDIQEIPKREELTR